MIVIREVDPKEFEGPLLLADAICFPEDAPIEAFKDWHWWGAFEGKELVGYAALAFPSADVAVFERVGVLPRARGQGLQVRFLKKAMALARLWGIKYVVSYTAADNHASIKSFRKAGFGEFWMHCFPTSVSFVRAT